MSAFNNPGCSFQWFSTGLTVVSLGLLRAVAAELQPELPGIEVLEERVGSSVLFSLRNPQLAELTVSLDFTAENLRSNVRLPLEVVLSPRSATRPLVVLRPADPAKTSHYTWRDNFTWGSPRTHQTAGQLYFLPFARGSSFPVAQGHGGAFSHTGEDHFAIDFGMPEGTPVLAARDGVVVLVRDGFGSGAPDPSYKKRANLIFVRHSDGTLGEYIHLLKGSIKVNAGDTVQAGQMLALSGNSGYTRGPHLHFMVFRAKDSKTRESLPIRFVTKEGAGLVLEEGRSYTPPILLDSPNASHY